MKRRLLVGQELVPILALIALCLLFFWKMLFTNLILARGDVFSYFYPYRDFAASALRDGRVPLWNPYLFMGAPLLANSQVGFFYPLNLLTSWLDVTRAINLNIVAHVLIATLGAYMFARRRLDASINAALLGGVSFGLGGYLGAQVEHFNQLQALAWMPWVWLAYERAAGADDRIQQVKASLLVGSLAGLMLLAGHTQSVFIVFVGLTAYALWPALEHWREGRGALRSAAKRLLPIVIAAIFGALLAAAQLLPTTELAALSPRGGGLSANEAVSFSLDPRLLGHALLPDYAGALPDGSEYTAFFGVTALVLMLIGLLVGWLAGPSTTQLPNYPTTQPSLRSLSIVAGLGLFLALGGFNPIYYVLVRFIPGFDLFRAPARWLALFAFGASMLASVGLDAVGRGFARKTRIANVLPSVTIALLIGLTYLGARIIPAGASGPIGSPGLTSLLLWIAVSILVLLLARFPHSTFRIPHSAFAFLCCLELFVATRNLPYHARLTAPDALTSLRPALTQLLIDAEDTPPARFLSISDILFDPGDAAELESIFADQLPPDAYYDLLIASKQKEIAAPNLPLYYRVPAVDGYDGGLLPLRTYLTFQRLFLAPEAIQSDGRLREQLKSIPDARWLNLMNVKYVITDKVRDRWLAGVFYDLQFTTRLEAGEAVFTDQLPKLEATALGLVYSEPSSASALAEVEVTFADGSTQLLRLIDEPLEVSAELAVSKVSWSRAQRVTRVRVRGASGLTLHGAALIDERSDTFESFVLAQGGRFRLAHSGDVKVYENADALPRAFVVSEARFAASDDEAIALMQRPDFDPSKTVVIVGETPSVLHPSSFIPQPFPRFTHYSPEYISLEVTADSAGYLVLTDAWYPGWVATVDGEPIEVLRADVLFRAVSIGAGTHRVEFRYEPATFRIGAAISIGAWAILGFVLVGYRRTRAIRAP